MSSTGKRAAFLVAALGLWALGPAEGLAQHAELDSLLSGQKEDSEAGSAAAPEVPVERTRTGERTEAESVPTKASEALRSRAIEEIVVTAQRREEQLHDVPISMSVLDGEFLRSQGVTDLQGVAQYVPNVRIDQAGGLILPRIRGFSTLALLTRGFEQAVGLTVDAFFFPSRGSWDSWLRALRASASPRRTRPTGCSWRQGRCPPAAACRAS